MVGIVESGRWVMVVETKVEVNDIGPGFPQADPQLWLNRSRRLVLDDDIIDNITTICQWPPSTFSLRARLQCMVCMGYYLPIFYLSALKCKRDLFDEHHRTVGITMEFKLIDVY